MVPKSSASTRLTRLWTGLTILLGVVSGLMLILYLSAALQWRSRPFIGVMFTPLMAVDESGPIGAIEWPGLDAGLQAMDQVIAINDQMLNPAPEGVDYAAMLANYDAVLRGLKFGRVIDIEFNRPGGAACPQTGDVATCRVNYIVQNFPPIDFAGFFVLPFAAGVISLLAGLAVLLLRPNQPEARLASIIGFALAVLLAGLFDLDTTHNFVPVWLVANPILAGAMATFGLVFPTRSAATYRRPWLLYLPFTLAILAIPAFLWLQYQPPSQAIQVIHYPTLLVVLSLPLIGQSRPRKAQVSPSRDWARVEYPAG